MRRPSLITELLSVSEVSLSVVKPTATRPHCTLLLGAILLAGGCQSSLSLTRFFNKPKVEQDKSVLTILDKDEEKDKAGLPLASKAKSSSSSGSPTKLLDQGQDALSTYYKDGNPAHLTEAHRCYEQALARESGNPESHHGLAIVCDLQKDYESAELHYRAALEGDPDNGKVLGDLGYSYLLQNRLSESEALLTQATKSDPGNTQATKNLAYVYAKQGNYNLADATFRRVLNDVEVRQEMAQLFPNGRPDMAREGERSKLPWQKNAGITTEEFSDRMNTAREQSMTEMRDKRTALDMATPETYTVEQQQAMIAQLTWERDQALRLADARSQQSSNTPLVLGNSASPSPGGVPGMQIRPQNDASSSPASDSMSFDSRQSNARPNQLTSNAGGRRAQNTLYPDGSGSQRGPGREGVEQASGQTQPMDRNGQRLVDQAFHETDRGIDPRTGMPLNTQIQQTDGQPPLLIPNGIGSSNSNGTNSGASPSGRVANFEEAKRRAAMAGLGGPEMMFPMATPEGGNRMAPGSGSTFNGGQFPAPQRMLPTDAAPHDLQQLMQSPSGNMTVQPNDMGMLNSPAGRSFSNPNFDQRLSPQIPIESPLGSQGMGYRDEVYSAQRNGQQPQQSPDYGQPGQRSGNPNYALGTQNEYPPSYDSRHRVNAELNQYGQSFQHNPAQYNSNSWNHTPTPANGLPNQPQIENPNQLMTPSWNQQQYTPSLTPPPYRGGQTQLQGDDRPAMSGGAGTYSGDSNPMSRGNNSAGAMYSEPAPIYSPGVQSPSAYSSGTRSANTYGQSFDGPRITPATR